GRRHEMTMVNHMVRVDHKGDVLYSQKLTVSLGCHMKLNHFPMDKQTCTMNIGSYGYTTENLKFEWDSITIQDGVQISEFTTPREVKAY
ncbi:hypothetical protein Ciccas_014255, partial [Cichlidogyrus casuarinus]